LIEIKQESNQPQNEIYLQAFKKEDKVEKLVR